MASSEPTTGTAKIEAAEKVRRDTAFIRNNDSLYAMPLQIVPFATPALCRGRLIRNAVLRPAIEVYAAGNGVSGQIMIEDVTPDYARIMFGWNEPARHPDYIILHKLARLTSYDVFSLRIKFRELELPVESIQYLTLSDEMKARLNGYMRIFTEPLVQHVYGDSIRGELGTDEIVRLFSNPKNDRALQRLKRLAEAIGEPVRAIPSFLEDFADIYLSVSYYQHYFDRILPMMADVVTEIKDLGESWRMKDDPNLRNTCRDLMVDLSHLGNTTTQRFETFYNSTDSMWQNISAEGFRSTERLIKSYHTTIGGVLCGLGIKMQAWKQRFPRRDVGGPQSRLELIASSMRPGMDFIKAIDAAAPAPEIIEVSPDRPAAGGESATIDPFAG